MQQLGTVAIGDVRIPVTSVELSGGEIVFCTNCPGPVDAARGHITIYGQDMQPIGHAPGEAVLPGAAAGEWLHYDVRLRMSQITQ